MIAVRKQQFCETLYGYLIGGLMILQYFGSMFKWVHVRFISFDFIHALGIK